MPGIEEEENEREEPKSRFSDLKASINQSIKDPEGTPDNLSIIELSPETSFKVLTKKRLQIFRTLKHGPDINSIKELATIVERRQEVVSRDLNILKNYGLIDFEEKGRAKIPKIVNGSDGIFVRID